MDPADYRYSVIQDFIQKTVIAMSKLNQLDAFEILNLD